LWLAGHTKVVLNRTNCVLFYTTVYLVMLLPIWPIYIIEKISKTNVNMITKCIELRVMRKLGRMFSNVIQDKTGCVWHFVVGWLNFILLDWTLGRGIPEFGTPNKPTLEWRNFKFRFHFLKLPNLIRNRLKIRLA
jgi:hypothetical protein